MAPGKFHKTRGGVELLTNALPVIGQVISLATSNSQQKQQEELMKQQEEQQRKQQEEYDKQQKELQKQQLKASHTPRIAGLGGM